MVKCRDCKRLDKLKGEVWFCGYWEDTLADSFVNDERVCEGFKSKAEERQR